jgi:phosphatidate cytidylyltransferase
LTEAALAAPVVKGRDLGRRVLTALVALPPLVFALFLGPPSLAVALVAAAALLGLFEFFAFLEARGLKPLRQTGLVLATAMFVEVARPGWHGGGPLWPFCALLLLIVTLRRGANFEETVPAAAGTLLGATYLGALGGTIAALRTLPPIEQGAWRMTLLLATIMVSDTLAFFVGQAFGRHRLAPQVSPHKTVEGAIGGLLGGVLGAVAVRALGLPALPVSHAAGLGLVVAGLGILGDLDESLLKRWAGVKDSGHLFPGHGGMLDRLDSLLFGAPVLYYYFLYVR